MFCEYSTETKKKKSLHFLEFFTKKVWKWVQKQFMTKYRRFWTTNLRQTRKCLHNRWLWWLRHLESLSELWRSIWNHVYGQIIQKEGETLIEICKENKSAPQTETLARYNSEETITRSIQSKYKSVLGRTQLIMVSAIPYIMHLLNIDANTSVFSQILPKYHNIFPK